MNSFQKKNYDNFKVRNAVLADIPNLVRLNQSWLKANLDNYENGFLSVAYDENSFGIIIGNNDLLVFLKESQIVGYVLVNSIQVDERVNKLRNEYFNKRAENLQKKIAFNYQILIDKPMQGTGCLYEAQKAYTIYYKKKYDLLVSTINKHNIRSINAHKKSGWNFINTTNNHYIVEFLL